MTTALRQQYPESWAGARMQLSPCQLQMGACAFCGPSFPSPRPALGSRAAADDVQPISCPHNVDVGCDCRSHCDHKLCFSSPCHSCPRRATACQRKSASVWPLPRKLFFFLELLETWRMRSTACPPLRAVLLCAAALPLITAFSPPTALRPLRVSSAATPVCGRVGPACPFQVHSAKSCQAAADEPVQSHRPKTEAVAFCCRLKGPAGAMRLFRCGQRRVGSSVIPFFRP